MQIVRDRRAPVEERLEERAGELERQRHAIAIVVMRDVLAPVRQADASVCREIEATILLIEIHIVIAAIHFPDRDDHRDDILADLADVLAFVNGETIQHFDHRFRAARLGGVQRAAQQIHGFAHLDQLSAIGSGKSARISEPAQNGLVFVELCNGRFVGDDCHHHLAALFRLPKAHDLHAIAGGIDGAIVLRRLGAVGQAPDGSGYVAERLQGRWHLGRRWHVVHHIGDELVLWVRWREFDDSRGVGGIDRLCAALCTERSSQDGRGDEAKQLTHVGSGQELGRVRVLRGSR